MLEQPLALRRQPDEERAPVFGIRDALRVAAPFEPLDAEDHRREWHTEPARQSGRRPRALGADQHVERIVLRGQLCVSQCLLDQALALLLRPEDLEENGRRAGAGHYCNLVLKMWYKV